jgi:TonB family protein
MYPPVTNDGQERPAAIDPTFLWSRNQRDAFLSHFGFRESPFGVTPDPEFLFFSTIHRGAFEAMIHSIESNLGFTVLLGEPGTGKTTLLFQLLKQYQYCARTAFVFQTQCRPHDLLRYVASELDLPWRRRDEVTLHQRLNELVVKEARAGRKVLIIIDEAQNLEHSSLEAVRLLSDFETPPAKLLHVVLAGSGRLGETLRAPELSQLAQRISTVCRLQPLGLEDVREYVLFRLSIAGRRLSGELFSPGAIAEAAERSGGVPRRLNSLCYRSLSLAYLRGEHSVSSEIVQQAACELDLAESGGMNFRMARPASESVPMAAAACDDGDLLSRFAASLAAKRETAPRSLELISDPPAETIDEEIRPEAATSRDLLQELLQPTVREQERKPGAIPAWKRWYFAKTNPPGHRLLRFGRLAGRLKAKSERVNLPRLQRKSLATVAAMLLVIFLGFWIGRYELRAKPRPSDHGSIVPQPDMISAAATPIVALPPPRQDSPQPETDSKKPLDARSRVDKAIVDTSAAAIPSRIKRPSAQQPDAAPANVTNVSGPDLARMSFADLPTSVPHLSQPAPPNDSSRMSLSSSLHPTKMVQPDYPALAKSRHIEGAVVLELVIGPKGNVQDVRTVSGNTMLRQAAIDAARQWQYSSYPEDQNPVVTQVQFNFRLGPQRR